MDRSPTHRVEHDPGLEWQKDAGPAIEAPPDTDPDPDPAAVWDPGAPRTGICGAVTPNVVDLPAGAYRMYYAGYQTPQRAYVLTATSQDGLAWTKHPEPVLAPGGPLDFAKCSEMCVAQVPKAPGQPARYRLFYEACDGTAVDARGVWRILSATSAPCDTPLIKLAATFD